MTLSHSQKLQIATQQLTPAYEYHAVWLSHYDGDTATFLVDLGLEGWTKQAFRLYGINTPELRKPTRDAGEAAKAYLGELKAKYAIADTAFGPLFKLKTHKRKRAKDGRQRAQKGKYGRYLAEILGLDRENAAVINLNDAMLRAGHAVEFMR